MRLARSPAPRATLKLLWYAAGWLLAAAHTGSHSRAKVPQEYALASKSRAHVRCEQEPHGCQAALPRPRRSLTRAGPHRARASRGLTSQWCFMQGCSMPAGPVLPLHPVWQAVALPCASACRRLLHMRRQVYMLACHCATCLPARGGHTMLLCCKCACAHADACAQRACVAASGSRGRRRRSRTAKMQKGFALPCAMSAHMSAGRALC